MALAVSRETKCAIIVLEPKRFKYKYVLKKHTNKLTTHTSVDTATDSVTNPYNREIESNSAKDSSQLMELLRNDIENFLATNTSLFFNERDIQVTLSLYLIDSKNYDEVDMEYSVPREELEERGVDFETGKFPWRNNMSVDIVVKKGDEYVPIELKYATRSVDKEILRFGEKMLSDALIIKNQAASNLIMYNYWKDVRRLETLCGLFHHIAGGIALIITNNSTFWNKPHEDSNYVAFAMSDGRTMTSGLKEWGKDTSPEIVKTHPSFNLIGTYLCNWHDTVIDACTDKGSKTATFRYLIQKIKK